MNNYVKFTIKSGDALYIRRDHITAIKVYNHPDPTYIYVMLYVLSGETFIVNETPDEVLDLLT